MRRLIVLLMLLHCVFVGQADLAWAAWLPPLGDVRILLGYGVKYSAGTHRGVDLAAEAGSEVTSPASGTVTFAGSVPADGGGTCSAVTIETRDGLRISLLPLESPAVASGAEISAGDTVGVVAGAGDDSSSEAHLHVGLRRGDAYIDPTSMLLPSVPEPAPAPGGAFAPTPIPAPQAQPPNGPALAAPLEAAAPREPAAPQSAPAALQPTLAPAPSASPSVGRPSVSRLPVDAGVPSPSSLRPDLRPPSSALRVSLQAPRPQSVRSVLLLLAMLAIAACIAAPRLVAARES